MSPRAKGRHRATRTAASASVAHSVSSTSDAAPRHAAAAGRGISGPGDVATFDAINRWLDDPTSGVARVKLICGDRVVLTVGAVAVVEMMLKAEKERRRRERGAAT